MRISPVWRNPKYATSDDQPQQQAPVDDGVELAAFPRNNGAEELRVGLKEYKGSRYIALRVWARDAGSGSYFPVRGKGVSVRLGEAEGVAEAFRKAIKTADEMRAKGGGRSEPDRGGGPEPRNQSEPKRRNVWGSPGQNRQEGAQEHMGRARGDRGPSGRPPWQGEPKPQPNRLDGSSFDEFSE
jgi:Transcriptional Coactivator p15 (PC4)